MKIIVGLGNPGKQYEHTRHNAGFLAVDHFLKGTETINCKSKFESTICELHFHATKTFFVKPQTFMNESGVAVRELLHFYKANYREDLLVIHDEADLPLGTIREAFNSSSAGHNGIQNIIDELGSQEFRRIRIGVDSRESRSNMPTDKFVLQNFSGGELSRLQMEVLPQVSKFIQEFIKNL